MDFIKRCLFKFDFHPCSTLLASKGWITNCLNFPNYDKELYPISLIQAIVCSESFVSKITED